MKIVWKICFSISLLFAFGSAYAASDDKQLSNLDEMSLAELKSSVPLGDLAENVKSLQNKEALRLINGKYNKQSGCTVETIRRGEVLIITIPSDKLFAPNDTVLTRTADEYLEPLKRYMQHPDMYRVLLVMHTDNTGSEEYTDALSLSRVDAVFDWFDNEDVDTRFVFPFASGSSDPLPNTPNISMTNRAKNRRLEVYLVPGEAMVKTMKSKKRD